MCACAPARARACVCGVGGQPRPTAGTGRRPRGEGITETVGTIVVAAAPHRPRARDVASEDVLSNNLNIKGVHVKSNGVYVESNGVYVKSNGVYVKSSGVYVKSNGVYVPNRRLNFRKEGVTLLDLCVSSLRRGHANLLCIVPILTDGPRRESRN